MPDPGWFVLRSYVIERARGGLLRIRLDCEEPVVRAIRRSSRAAREFELRASIGDPSYTFAFCISPHSRAELVRLLDFYRDTVLLRTNLNQCWALDRYSDGAGNNTTTGQMVHDAKYGPGVGRENAALKLAVMMAEHYARHPAIRTCDRILGVPANPPNVPFNLPDLLAERIGSAWGLRVSSDLVVKTRPTGRRISNDVSFGDLVDAYEVAGSLRKGEVIAVVDDVVGAGATLAALDFRLRGAGVRAVLGLTAVTNLSWLRDWSV